VSCVLLRLLSLWWWRGALWRACWGVLLAASLATTIVLSVRIALVEVPDITPALAADIHMPRLHQLVAAAVLVLLLVSAAARRWSEPPPVGSAVGNWSWRRDEGRYYHERRILLLPLAGVMLILLVREGLMTSWWIINSCSRGLLGDLEAIRYWLVGLFESPQICLSLALIVLAVQSAFPGWSKCPDANRMDPPRLAPGLFLLIWSVLLAIVVFGVPILGAWDFRCGSTWLTSFASD